MGRIDDHEHLGGEVGALAVEQHARNLYPIDLLGMSLAKEMQRRKAMLTVDNKIPAVGLAQKTDAFRRVRAPEAQRFIGEGQDRAWNQRLANRRLVEIDNLADLPPVKQPLKGLFAFLDSGDELGNLIVAGFIGLYLLTFEIVAARKAHPVEQLRCFIGDKVKSAFLLQYSCCQHGSLLLNRVISLRQS